LVFNEGLKKETQARPKLNAVIFDLDGLLVNSEQLYLRTLQEVIESKKVEVEREILEMFVGLDRPLATKKLADIGFSNPTANEIIDSTYMLCRERSSEELQLMAGALDAINYAKKNAGKVALLTCSSKDSCQIKTELVGISNKFDLVLTGNDCVMPKPAPDIYLRALSLMNVDPKRCVAFEDSNVGVAAASAAGMRVFLVPDQQKPAEVTVKMSFSISADLPSAILNLQTYLQSLQ
jgi:HAD superfamily hydrolase (TIGR01509 family)